MITQEHENEIQQRAQAPYPVKQHRWRVALFSNLGVALPLVAGSMFWWPWGVPDFMDSQGVFITVVLAGVVSVTVGAFLLCFAFRAMWVAVFAGVAWIVGEFLCLLVRTLVVSGWPALQTWDPFWSVQVGIVGLALVPLLFCMAFGAAVASRWMD
jgi:hypothetical protein